MHWSPQQCKIPQNCSKGQYASEFLVFHYPMYSVFPCLQLRSQGNTLYTPSGIPIREMHEITYWRRSDSMWDTQRSHRHYQKITLGIQWYKTGKVPVLFFNIQACGWKVIIGNLFWWRNTWVLDVSSLQHPGLPSRWEKKNLRTCSNTALYRKELRWETRWLLNSKLIFRMDWI